MTKQAQETAPNGAAEKKKDKRFEESLAMCQDITNGYVDADMMTSLDGVRFMLKILVDDIEKGELRKRSHIVEAIKLQMNKIADLLPSQTTRPLNVLPLREQSFSVLLSLHDAFDHAHKSLCFYTIESNEEDTGNPRWHIFETLDHVSRKKERLIDIAKEKTPSNAHDAEFRAIILNRRHEGSLDTAKMVKELVDAAAFEEKRS
jgi:hypothetical protein